MDLPESVVFEIFMRLPVRSLLRFRSVCKDWFSLINSPVFKEKHLAYRIAREEESLILVYDWRGAYLTCYSDHESLLARACGLNLKASSYTIYTRGIRWWMHVNGIVCLEDGSKTIHLLNPSLREIRAVPNPFPVPQSVADHDYYVIKAGGFVCDDIFGVKRRVVGFGYDDSTKDYILVQILGDDKYSPICHYKCVVYHIMTDSWMMVEIPEFMTSVSAYFGGGGCFSSSLFSHGSIHWLISLVKPDNNIYWILTFNVANKLFQEIQFPRGWNVYYKSPEYPYPYLFKVDDSCIALVVKSTTGDEQQEGGLDIWMMKEYGVTESWTKQYSIGPYYYCRPLCFLKTDKLLLLTMEDRNRNNRKKMVCYHLSKGQAEDVWYEEWPGEAVSCCYESLISINKSSKLEKMGQQSLQQVAGSVLEKDAAMLIQGAGQQLESLSHETEGDLAENVLAPRNSLYVDTNESKKESKQLIPPKKNEGKVEGNHVSPSLPPSPCKGVVEVTTDLLLTNSFEMLSMLPPAG